MFKVDVIYINPIRVNTSRIVLMSDLEVFIQCVLTIRILFTVFLRKCSKKNLKQNYN
jgi:hypothetical protein